MSRQSFDISPYFFRWDFRDSLPVQTFAILDSEGDTLS